MTVKLFHTSTTKKMKEIAQYFAENNIEYVTQDIIKQPLTWEEFKGIIDMAEDGVNSIMPGKKSKQAQIIIDSIDFDTITLREFYELSIKNPCIIRTPIMQNRNNLMIGFNQDEICIFNNRKTKRARFNQLLESVRMMESYTSEQAMRYSI